MESDTVTTLDFAGISPIAPPTRLPPSDFLQFYEHQLLSLIEQEAFDDVQAHWEGTWANTGRFHELLTDPQVILYCRLEDRQLFGNIMSRLFPDVLQRTSPQYSKLIRSFSKRIEDWLRRATELLPQPFSIMKLEEASTFAQRLRRYTSLNHLASAARGVLAKEEHVQQMTEDFSHVDFESIQEQIVWVCEGCDSSFIMRAEAQFRAMQPQSHTVERWASWLQALLKDVMGSGHGPREYVARASSFQLHWSFASSLVIRDLTLRSAASFGMFHLMRLLCDEYVFFLLERYVMLGQQPTITHHPDGGDERRAHEEGPPPGSHTIKRTNAEHQGLDPKKAKV